MKERERELRKRKEREEKEMERVKLKVRRKEAEYSYRTLLVEMIKDPKVSALLLSDFYYCWVMYCSLSAIQSHLLVDVQIKCHSKML